jgi:hypothetical protein
MSNGGSERSWLARVAIKSRYKRRRATHCVALVAAHGGEHRQAAGAVGGKFGSWERNLHRAVLERRLVERLNPGSVEGFQQMRKPRRETGLAGWGGEQPRMGDNTRVLNGLVGYESVGYRQLYRHFFVVRPKPETATLPMQVQIICVL